MAGIDILAVILIIAFVLAYVLFLYVLKAMRGTLGWIVTIVGALTGLLLIAYLISNITNIVPADWAQILILLGLVTVTAMYALSTRKQADASAKMAEEMREQRYDTVRPVIDMQWYAEDETRRLGEAASSPSQLVTEGFSCIIRNIGLGPAVDVYSYIRHHSRGRLKYDFGTVAIDTELTLFPTILSPKQEGERVVMDIHYKDIYGREFESIREITGKVGDWKLGPLQIRPKPGGNSK